MSLDALFWHRFSRRVRRGTPWRAPGVSTFLNRILPFGPSKGTAQTTCPVWPFDQVEVPRRAVQTYGSRSTLLKRNRLRSRIHWASS